MKGINGAYPYFRIQSFGKFYMTSPIDITILNNEFRVDNFFLEIAFRPSCIYSHFSHFREPNYGVDGRKWIFEMIRHLGLEWKKRKQEPKK